jgi:hypothetical protein
MASEILPFAADLTPIAAGSQEGVLRVPARGFLPTEQIISEG